MSASTPPSEQDQTRAQAWNRARVRDMRPQAPLRPLLLADAPSLVTACHDPDVLAWTSVPLNYTEQMAYEFISRDQLAWAIVDASDAFSGCIDLRFYPDPQRPCDIGYYCAPWARRRGLTLAALSAVTAYAFELGEPRVDLHIAPANHASQRLAAKAGYTRNGDTTAVGRDGTERPHWVFSKFPRA